MKDSSLNINRDRILRDWVIKLEDNSYKQTTGCLRNEGGYCCLGVLLDIISKESLSKDTWSSEVKFNEDVLGGAYLFGNDSTSLPSEISDDLGIYRELEETLQDMNDREKKTFPEIAKYIKDNIL